MKPSHISVKNRVASPRGWPKKRVSSLGVLTICWTLLRVSIGTPAPTVYTGKGARRNATSVGASSAAARRRRSRRHWWEEPRKSTFRHRRGFSNLPEAFFVLMEFSVDAGPEDVAGGDWSNLTAID